MTIRLTICLHHQMLSAFAEINMQAVADLNAQVLVNGDAAPSAMACTTIDTGDASYHQSMLALLRHAGGDYVMLADGAVQLQPPAILAAMAQLDAASDMIASAGGISDLSTDFDRQLAPAGIVIRKEAAWRFVHVTEYGLLAGWHTLAQLARSGKILITPKILSHKLRVSSSYPRSFDVLTSFFNGMQPPRYCGFLTLYDPVTIDYYLADAEQFLLFWPDYADLDATERTKRMFAKRAQLYAEASRQATADGETTIGLHFAVRAQLTGRTRLFTRTEISALKNNVHYAIGEQLHLLASLLGEGATLKLEDHIRLRTLGQHVKAIAADWLPRKTLLSKAFSPKEIIVFHHQKDVLMRLSKVPEALPGRHFSYEQLSGFVMDPAFWHLHGLGSRTLQTAAQYIRSILPVSDKQPAST